MSISMSKPLTIADIIHTLSTISADTITNIAFIGIDYDTDGTAWIAIEEARNNKDTKAVFILPILDES